MYPPNPSNRIITHSNLLPIVVVKQVVFKTKGRVRLKSHRWTYASVSLNYEDPVQLVELAQTGYDRLVNRSRP